MELNIPQETLQKQMRIAIEWLTGVACVHDNKPVGAVGEAFDYKYWNGAIRGEYSAATRTWGVSCPYWHTGQAVKALVMASGALQDDSLLEKARFSAGFLLANQREDGLFPAQEVTPGEINTSATLESVDGLFYLSDATGDEKYRNAALAALDWVAKRAWMPDVRKFKDIYNAEKDDFIYGTPSSQDRPLIDDAVFLKAYHLTGDPAYKKIILDAAQTLLENEDPPGNWVIYIPSRPVPGFIHPRHAFWWGLPMLSIYHETGDEKYKDVFFRAVEWYRRALRQDGGMFRLTFRDFSTHCFGHATSGSACAARCFMAAFRESGKREFLDLAEAALSYCGSMLLSEAKDPNLRGAVLEKIMPPDGTDNLPYHIRDLGTIFFIQAAAEYLEFYCDNK